MTDVVEASDGLLTAGVHVNGKPHAIKIDSGARYSVTGTAWIDSGEQVRKPAPVDFIEGIGGFLIDVVDVWAFEMRNMFGQVMTVEACTIDGCQDEFMVGVNFLELHKANIDFRSKEVRYDDRGWLVIIAFRTGGASHDDNRARVRLVGATKLRRRAVQPIEVSVTAPYGEEGIFIPTGDFGCVPMDAADTKAHRGKAVIPVINVHGGQVCLRSKQELGVWIPVDSDITMLEMHGKINEEQLKTWIDVLGDGQTPLDGEGSVNTGTNDPNALHHTNTGGTASIMMRIRRQAQTEDAVVDENVDTMLNAGVVEPGEGAWDFSVVLVRKKDGAIRFSIDYRALNAITKKDVYPLSHVPTIVTSGIQMLGPKVNERKRRPGRRLYRRCDEVHGFGCATNNLQRGECPTTARSGMTAPPETTSKDATMTVTQLPVVGVTAAMPPTKTNAETTSTVMLCERSVVGSKEKRRPPTVVTNKEHRTAPAGAIPKETPDVATGKQPYIARDVGIDEPTQRNNNAVRDEFDGDEVDRSASDTLQLPDTEIMTAQKDSKFVQKVLTDGVYRGIKVESWFGHNCNKGWLGSGIPTNAMVGSVQGVARNVEYITMYAMACCVETHTAESVATFIMEEVIVQFGAFRELLTDGSLEIAGEVIDKLTDFVQARQVNPVAYRSQLIGLVERFHRSWKD
ncbi:hypothetical protein PHMEG_00015163 [Phytophthora megakarya]|uniref:Integrase catalytic domain-containing protein n=1 Tax=Phytophthora megakarya TaxID=4795 RepID=A0A225W4J8_9STRA|nr:hypothetical protein PHMEG_00015163 [Phytophthora megakarya]